MEWTAMKKTADKQRTAAADQPSPNTTAPGAPPPAAQPGRRNWRPLFFLLVCLVGSSVVSFVVFGYLTPGVPRALIGTWEVKDGDLRGATLEFHRHGAGVATMHKGGKKLIVNSSVKVDGDKILMTSADELTGKPDTVIQTILKLTDNELVIRDVDNNTYRMVRISD